MKITGSRGAKALALVALVSAVGACGLPRSGPNKAEIFKGSVLKQGDAFIVTVNSRVTRATAVTPDRAAVRQAIARRRLGIERSRRTPMRRTMCAPGLPEKRASRC